MHHGLFVGLHMTWSSVSHLSSENWISVLTGWNLKLEERYTGSGNHKYFVQYIYCNYVAYAHY